MTRLFLFLLFALSLAACENVPVWEYNQSPNSMIAAGQTRLSETARAVQTRSAQATLQAAETEQRTEQEIRVIMAPLKAEETRLALSLTAGAATDTAARSTSTAGALHTTATYQAGLATGTAQAAAADQLRRETLAWVWSWIPPVLTVFAVGLITTASLLMAWRSQEARIENDRLRAKVAARWTAAAAGQPGAKTAPTPDQPEPRLVSFVQQAIAAAGPQASTVPRWDAMRVSSAEWQWCAASLEALGAISKTHQGTTTANGYTCLGQLQAALLSGELAH